MTPLSLAPLFGAVLNLVLTAMVITSDPKSRINRSFFLWGLSITVWNLGTFALFVSPDVETAKTWARFMQFGVIFIPVSLFHLSLLLARVEARKSLIALYTMAIALALSNFTDFFIRGVRFVGYAYYSVAGPGFWIFTLTFGATMASIFVLVRERRKLPPHSRKGLDGLIAAQAVLVCLGTNDILPILGVDEYPFTDIVIFPYGSIAAVFYGVVVGYSTLHNQLLNVHVALGRFGAHLVRFVFLFTIGLILHLLVAAAIPGRIGSFEIFTSLSVLLVSTLVASLLFPRLVGAPSEQLERRLLGDRFEYQDQVRSFMERMTWHADLESLLDELQTLLLRSFKLENYAILLRDEITHDIEISRCFPTGQFRDVPRITPNSRVVKFFGSGKVEYLSLSRKYLRLSSSPLERPARGDLDSFGAEFCFPLAWQEELFGMLLVGPKTSGDPFTPADINLLVALSKSLSVVTSHLRLKTQVMQVQELDLLGRMSRGMAHDLNNLLTPVSTLLQLASETGECDEELLPTALRNVTTMRAYIKESLFFSEHSKPDLRDEYLNRVVARTVELVRDTRKKQVEIISDLGGEYRVQMNEVLIQRLITNLISNAIDASAPGTMILVQLEKLPKTEGSREWFRLRIVDQGEGISRENLDRVQTPYFTTKNRGDETRGFGLGLAICRKIVTLHGGRLSIESQLRKGTTVQVDLPSRPITTVRPTLLPASTAVQEPTY